MCCTSMNSTNIILYSGGFIPPSPPWVSDVGQYPLVSIQLLICFFIHVVCSLVKSLLVQLFNSGKFLYVF